MAKQEASPAAAQPCAAQPDATLQAYVETAIIPRYAAFDAAHREDHVRTVIRQSLLLAARYQTNPDMVYTAAAYHDVGLACGREAHHLHSGAMLAADPELRRWFTPPQIAVMREAVEDHRASSSREPRSIYGRIVAEADRCIDPVTVIRRTILYGRDRCPELNREEHYIRCREHLLRKYAAAGYLRLWIPESDNARKIEELRRIIADETLLRSLFDRLYDEETATGGRP